METPTHTAPPVALDRLVRPWRAMRTAPKTGIEIEVLVYHMNRRYAKRSEKSQWESVETVRWIDHNAGGWTWNGMTGQFKGWRPTAKAAAAKANGAKGGRPRKTPKADTPSEPANHTMSKTATSKKPAKKNTTRIKMKTPIQAATRA